MIKIKAKKNIIVKLAFTLAEVLIVLGIIGIVAELTIPVVLHNFQKQTAIVKLQKMYTNLAQAIKLSEIENGSATGWVYGAQASYTDTLTFFDTYLKPYIRTTEVTPNSTNNGIYVKLSDGTTMTFYMDSATGMQTAFHLEPGKTGFRGKNAFYYVFDKSKINVLQPYAGGTTGTGRAKWLSGSEACTPAGNKGVCAGLVMNDGWQILSDYPYFN